MDVLLHYTPEPFDFGCPNVSAAWKKWQQRFALFLTASGNSDASSAKKVAILLTILGERGYDIYSNFRWAPAEGDRDAENRNDFDTVLRKFEQYSNTRNPVMALRA